jgi:hypothetical protein
MSKINYQELKRMCESDGFGMAAMNLCDAIQKCELKPDDFSIRELANVILGEEIVNKMDPRLGKPYVLDENDKTMAFVKIVKQIVFTKVSEAYNQDAFVFSKMVDTIPVWLEEPDSITDTPENTKKGFIIPITNESVFFDRTHLILQRASEVGEVLGLNKEKRLLDLLIGASNNYMRKGIPYKTYSSTGTGDAPDGDWINVINNELTNWSDVDVAERLFADIIDPDTNEPILGYSTSVLVTPAYRHAAHRIFNATEIKYISAKSEAIAANPLKNYAVVESRLAYRRLLVALGLQASDASKYWFIGDFKKAFSYAEDWPLSVSQVPINGVDGFSQDTILRLKASESGKAQVKNPRHIVMSTGSKLV